ncbi:hypothetical protein DFH06DRAFT_1323323 [Mycena polygramma]|nr:hypothetical protein DFH06DRAFT_1323323 [Mycena polygramma]
MPAPASSLPAVPLAGYNRSRARLFDNLSYPLPTMHAIAHKAPCVFSASFSTESSHGEHVERVWDMIRPVRRTKRAAEDVVDDSTLPSPLQKKRKCSPS